MARRAHTVLEYRDYDLPVQLPIIALTGDIWRISDIPSGVLHFHNCLEIGICQSDSGTLEFQDYSYHFKEGDITLISKDMPHTTYSSPGTASKWSYLFVDPEQLIAQVMPLVGLQTASRYLGMQRNSRLFFSAEQDPMLRVLAEDMVREVEDKRPGYDDAVRGLFCAFLMKVCRLTSYSAPNQATVTMPIAPALQHIDEHYMDNFSIDDLADLCRLSPSHFRRVFRDIMGTGPLEYLNRTRISRACSLLRMTDASMLSICEAVGFRSLSSFNRHFASIMGEPPTEWRRRMNSSQPILLHKYAGWLTPPPKI